MVSTYTAYNYYEEEEEGTRPNSLTEERWQDLKCNHTIRYSRALKGVYTKTKKAKELSAAIKKMKDPGKLKSMHDGMKNLLIGLEANMDRCGIIPPDITVLHLFDEYFPEEEEKDRKFKMPYR